MTHRRRDPESGIFSIRFRYSGRSFNRSLKTRNDHGVETIHGVATRPVPEKRGDHHHRESAHTALSGFEQFQHPFLANKPRFLEEVLGVTDQKQAIHGQIRSAAVSFAPEENS